MIKDCLMVGYDQSVDDITTLTVARGNHGEVKVLNTIRGDKAFGIYQYLIGNVTIKNNKEIDEIIFQLKCIKEHLKYISKTTDKSVDFDIEVLEKACISRLEKLE